MNVDLVFLMTLKSKKDDIHISIYLCIHIFLQLQLIFVLIYIFCQHYALVSQKSVVSIEIILGRVLKKERKKH